MKTIQFREWELVVDSDATKSVYNKVAAGKADNDLSDAFINFVNCRKTMLPDEIKTLFDALGIDANKECENTYLGKQNNDLHLYSAWFHFKGNFTSSIRKTQINDTFSIGFSKNTGSTFFKNTKDLVLVEFFVEIPWTIEKPFDI